jgi:hypothetical protein
MNTFRALFVGLLVACFNAAAFAQTQWGVDVETEKLTDQKVLTATAGVGVSGASSALYQLSLRCDEKSRMVTIVTLDGLGLPRGIQWGRLPSYVVGSVQYRINNGRADSSMLIRDRHSKAGVTTVLDDKVRQLSPAHRATGIWDHDVPAVYGRLPATILLNRVVIGGMFPDETVEFSFAAMTPLQRGAVQKMCFPAPVPAASAPTLSMKEIEGSSPPAPLTQPHPSNWNTMTADEQARWTRMDE